MYNLIVIQASIAYSMHVQLCLTLCDLMDYIASQASLSMEFSRQEYWSALPFPSPGDFPDPGIEPRPPALQADALPSEPKSSVKFSVTVTMALQI